MADNKGKYFCNLWAGLIGKKTFVGYTPVNEEALSTLPKLKPSILYTVDDINLEIYDQDIIMQLNNLYARNYSVWRDQADQEMEKIDEWINKNHATDYFFMTNTI